MVVGWIKDDDVVFVDSTTIVSAVATVEVGV
jgi:hypothetical protein